MILKYCHGEVTAKHAVPPFEVWGLVDAKNDILTEYEDFIIDGDPEFCPGWLTDSVSNNSKLFYFKVSSFLSSANLY